MTTFNPSQLPASITTVEALAVWASAILQDVNFDTTITEVTNGSALPVASVTPFNIRSDTVTGVRSICRLSIPMNTNYQTADGLWTATQEISTGTIPTAYQ